MMLEGQTELGVTADSVCVPCSLQHVLLFRRVLVLSLPLPSLLDELCLLASMRSAASAEAKYVTTFQVSRERVLM